MSTRRQVAAPGEPRSGTTTTLDPNVTALADVRMTRRRSSGWDPYEVWRTRVKGEEEETAADDAGASPAA